MSKVSILVGDCLTRLKQLPDNSTDAIITDPPYFKVKGEAWDNQWSDADKFIEWIGTVAEQWQRLLKPNGSLYCFASSRMSARVEVELSRRFNILNRIRWAKPKFATKAEMFRKEDLRTFFPSSEEIIFAEHYGAKSLPGHMESCRKSAGFSRPQVGRALSVDSRLVDKWETQRGERDSCEPTDTQFDAAMRLYGRDSEVECWRRPFNAMPDAPYTDTWTFDTVKSYPGKHPCEKPQELLRHILRTSTRPGAVVLDCFMGGGSMGEACVREGRDFIGMEQNEEYVATARKRIADACGLFGSVEVQQ